MQLCAAPLARFTLRTCNCPAIRFSITNLCILCIKDRLAFTRHATPNSTCLTQNSRRTSVSHNHSEEEEAELSGERAAPPKGDDGSLYEDMHFMELEDMQQQEQEQQQQQLPRAGPGKGPAWLQASGPEQGPVIR